MFSLERCGPWVVNLFEFKIPDNFIVIFRFGERLCFIFEAIGVKRRSYVIIVIDYFKLGSEPFSDLCVVFLPPRLDQFRDVDIFGPLLFVLFPFESLDFDQISHFNFDI